MLGVIYKHSLVPWPVLKREGFSLLQCVESSKEVLFVEHLPLKGKDLFRACVEKTCMDSNSSIL